MLYLYMYMFNVYVYVQLLYKVCVCVSVLCMELCVVLIYVFQCCMLQVASVVKAFTLLIVGLWVYMCLCVCVCIGVCLCVCLTGPMSSNCLTCSFVFYTKCTKIYSQFGLDPVVLRTGDYNRLIAKATLGNTVCLSYGWYQRQYFICFIYFFVFFFFFFFLSIFRLHLSNSTNPQTTISISKGSREKVASISISIWREIQLGFDNDRLRYSLKRQIQLELKWRDSARLID